MVLEPVLCPTCGSRDVSNMVNLEQVSSVTSAVTPNVGAVPSSERMLIEATYPMSNNNLQTWR